MQLKMTNVMKNEDPDYLHNNSDGFTHHAETVAEHRESYGSAGIRRPGKPSLRLLDDERFKGFTASLHLTM